MPVSRIDQHRPVALRVGDDLQRHRAAAAGVPHGILQQGIRDATEPPGFRPHPDRGGGQRQGQGHPGPIPVGAAGLDRLAADLAQVDVLRLQRDQAAGQPGDLQDILDDPREAVNLAIHQLVQVGGEPGIARPAPQQVQAIADRRQGIAQLVGQQAEQLVLAARRIGQPPDLLLQFLLATCGLGQVADDVGEAADLAGRAPHGGDRHLGPEPRAVLVPASPAAHLPSAVASSSSPRPSTSASSGDCSEAMDRPTISSAP